MKYVKAQDVLPEEIIEILQKYVDGKYLYIPRKNENQKAWGENSGIRKALMLEILRYSKNIKTEPP